MARLLSGRRREPAEPREEREKPLRLFVAIELPWEVRRSVVHTMESLKTLAGERALRWVRPEAIHLTLAFLGATPEARVEEIKRALTVAVRDVTPFPLVPLGVGSFGGRGRLRVVWIGVGGDGGALSELAERVGAALVPLGYPREDRAFNGHLTLARARDAASRDELAKIHDLLTSFDPPEAPGFTVDHVSLMQSLTGPNGSAYRQLATAPLLGAAGATEGA
jgi:2'-5' RNA ligase